MPGVLTYCFFNWHVPIEGSFAEILSVLKYMSKYCLLLENYWATTGHVMKVTESMSVFFLCILKPMDLLKRVFRG